VPASEKAKVGTPDARSGVPPLDEEDNMTINKTAGAEKREKLRNEYWPDEDAWTGVNEKGWFRAPRTLPLLLSLMRSKALSGRVDPTGVPDLLCRWMS
jgi:hypothetical protein